MEKIVQRVPVTPSSDNDLVTLIDLIEIELDLSTGRKSVRSRLFEIANELGAGNRVPAPECLSTLIEVVGRLEKIEEYMRGYGFETARDTSPEQASN